MTLNQLVDACGWTLLHSVWQIAGIALLLAVALRILSSERCNVRYLCACVALLLMIAAIGGTFTWELRTTGPFAETNEIEEPIVRELPGEASPAIVGDAAEASESIPPLRAVATGNSEASPALEKPVLWRAAIESWLSEWIAPIVGLWIGGVSLLSLRLCTNWLALRRLRATGCAIKQPVWTRALSRIQNRLAVSQPVKLLQSSAAATPMVIGWLKPVVLVPMELVSGLTSAEIEAILAHELAHIRRHDYLVNLLQNVAETLLFYHPAVWWVSREIRREREFCCDDIAARLCEGTAIYARALATVETMRSVPPALSVAASGGSLLDRIRRLAGREPRQAVGASGAMTAGLVLSCAAVLLIALMGQTADAEETGKLSDEEATAIARKAHEMASQIEKLLTFSYEVSHRYGTIATLQEEPECTISTLIQALDGEISERHLFHNRTTLAWDEERLLYTQSATQPIESDGGEQGGGAAYFGTNNSGWARENWDRSNSSLLIRRKDINSFCENMSFTTFLGFVPRNFWWGANLDHLKGHSHVPPGEVIYRHVGTESLRGDPCHVLEASSRNERLWVSQKSGLIRGTASYFCSVVEPSLYSSETVHRIAGRSFASAGEYATWYRDHYSNLARAQQVELEKEFNELCFENATPGNLTVFTDYREVSPGVWFPFKEERTVCHPNEDKFKYYLNVLTIDRVALDVALEERFEELAPKKGEKVQDQRFEAIIDCEYDPELTGEDFKPLIEAKQKELAEGQQLVKELTAPMERMVGQPALELAGEGWIGERPDLTGKPYLIHFWATWCGPCKNDLPILKNVAKKHQIIGIHPSGTPVEEISKFVDDETLGYSTFVAAESDDELVAGYPVKMYPYCVVVNEDGKVAAHGRLGVEVMDKLREAEEKAQAAPPNGFRNMTVRTVDDAGKPVAKTRIYVSIWPDEDNKYKTSKKNYFTDAEGNIEVLVPDPPRLFRVWTQQDGYVPLFAQWWPEQQPDGDQIPEAFTFTLPTGTKIGGTVVDDAGKPIEGATVEVMLVQQGDLGRLQRPVASTWLAEVPGPGENPCITDAEGRWSLNNVPAGENELVRVKLTHTNYISDIQWGSLQAAQQVTMESLRNETAQITMHSGPRATGTVTDADGKPIADAVVIWGDDPYLQTGSQEVRTDAQGQYKLPPLTPGLYTLTVVAKNWRPELSFVEIEPEMEPHDFQLKQGNVLRVKFVDENGEPIPEVYVGIREWRGKESLYNHRHPNVLDTKIPIKSDERGIYEWTWAPPDGVKYSFGKKGFQSTELILIADGEEFVVEMKAE